MSDDLAVWLTAILDEEGDREASKYRTRAGMELAEAMTAEDGLMFIRWEHGGRPEWISQEKYVSEFLEPAPDRTALARIAAERRLIAEYIERHDDADLMLGPASERQRQWAGLRLAVMIIGTGYADRPGYREDWRP